jgi:predicted DNA-binding protein
MPYKPEHEESRKYPLSAFRIPPELKEKIKRAADERKTTTTEIVVEALEEWLANHLY